MTDWIPVMAAVFASAMTLFTRRVSATVSSFIAVVGATVWSTGGLNPVEPIAASLVGLAAAASIPSPAARAWLGLAVTGILWPAGDVAGAVGPAMVGGCLVSALLASSPIEGRIPVTRWASFAALWIVMTVFVQFALPAEPHGGPVDDLAASRGRVPAALVLFCGFALVPVHTFLLDACRRGSLAATAVVPILGLATFQTLDVSVLIRGPLIGDLAVLFFPLGLITLTVGGLLTLAQGDLRYRLVAAQVGLGGWSVAIWFDDPAAARVLWATVAVASVVAGGVVNRLEHRYRSRERNAYGGLAERHPTAAVTLGFSAVVVAKAAAGPVVMSRALPVAATINSSAVVIVLVVGLLYAAAFGDMLRELLFGVPHVPEYEGPLFERVGKRPTKRAPLVGPIRLVAWGLPLLFVIGLSVAPYNVIKALGESGRDPSSNSVEPSVPSNDSIESDATPSAIPTE